MFFNLLMLIHTETILTQLLGHSSFNQCLSVPSTHEPNILFPDSNAVCYQRAYQSDVTQLSILTLLAIELLKKINTFDI